MQDKKMQRSCYEWRKGKASCQTNTISLKEQKSFPSLPGKDGTHGLAITAKGNWEKERPTTLLREILIDHKLLELNFSQKNPIVFLFWKNLVNLPLVDEKIKTSFF